MSDDKKIEHAVTTLLWPPLEKMPENATAADRINLADYIKDDPKAGNNSDDWGFVFDEKEYPNCERATQEKLVAHINLSCGEQGFSMTVHTWANNETRGTLRIRLKCSNNRRSKCKYAFQVCYGVAEGFWYLRRGSGNHIHCGHDLDKPKFARLNKMRQRQNSRNPPEPSLGALGVKRPAPLGQESQVSAGLQGGIGLDSHPPTKQVKGDSFMFQSLGFPSASDMGKSSFPSTSFITNPDNPFSMGSASGQPYETGINGQFFQRQDMLGRNMTQLSEANGHLSQPPPPLSYQTLEQSAIPSQASQPYGLPVGHSVDEREAARSMIVVAAAAKAPPPIDNRQVSSETENRRNRFIASASRYSQFADSASLGSSELGRGGLPRESAIVMGETRAPGLPEPARRNTLPISNTSKSSGRLDEEDPSQTERDARAASSADFMYSSSNLTQAIKDELKGFMSSTTSLIDPKKPIPEELKGFMASTNSLLIPKTDSEEAKQTESFKQAGKERTLDAQEPSRASKDVPEKSSGALGDFTTPHSRAPASKSGVLGDYTAGPRDFNMGASRAAGLAPSDGLKQQSSLGGPSAPLRSALKPSDEVERLRQERQRAFGGGRADYGGGALGGDQRPHEVERNKSSGSAERSKYEGKLGDPTLPPVGERGSLADHSSSANPPRSISFKAPAHRRESGALADYTAEQHRPMSKASKGASFYSSIDTFGMSSGSLGIGESVDDLNKLEGFGQGTPSSAPKENPAKGS